MSAETAHQQDALTREQLATVERARNTPFVISRSRRRPPGVKRWSFKPRIELAREIDVVELLDRGRYADASPVVPDPKEERK
ncbi:MAG: hypothetical protein M3439_04850 [Chloroflexota bacterium]|nr:hypothetical protein [Chloroflexota bacterium]